jgi:hypothetical protein
MNRALALPLLVLGLVVVMLPAVVQAADAFRITNITTRLDEGTYRLGFDIDFDFSEQALEALENGVPLTIMVHIQLRAVDAWIWNDSVVDARLRYAIRYKPLSERYEVYRLPGNRGRSFVSREAAIAALGEFRDLDLVSASALDPGSDYEVHIKTELDIEELPLPLRPIAYLRPAWDLESSWKTWPLRP